MALAQEYISLHVGMRKNVVYSARWGGEEELYKRLL
jgi:hypothetical protein